MTLLKIPPYGYRYDGKPVKPVRAWSHSAVTSFEDCPQRFYAVRILGFPDPPSKALLNGRKVHQAGAEYLQVPGTPLPATYRHFGGMMEHLRKLGAYADLKMQFREGWELHRGSNFDPEVWLRLEWDAGVVYEDKTADIIDFKTGKRYDDKNDDQMELYALSAFLKFRVDVAQTRLWYLDSGLEVRATFTRDHAPALMSKWTERAMQMLNAKDYPPRPNKMCQYCPVSKHKGGPCAEG